ncbi:hypothetical protein Barb6_02366 [Bacteroidales bacterium Barb6]|nr:hypothetical protein Barb6_02366 [Bacteroidales bacterium Barb6]
MNQTVQEIFDADSGFLRAKDISNRTQWSQLNIMFERGSVVKVKRGLYLMTETPTDQSVEIANMLPNDVFCMFTAWDYYKLTTNNPFEFHVAIGSKDKIVLLAYPPVKLYYWTDKSYRLGSVEIKEDKHAVKMYDLEKSVCDAVRFRNKIGMDTVTEILRNYIKRKDRDLDRLMKYAGQLRIGNIIETFLTVML